MLAEDDPENFEEIEALLYAQVYHESQAESQMIEESVASMNVDKTSKEAPAISTSSVNLGGDLGPVTVQKQSFRYFDESNKLVSSEDRNLRLDNRQPVVPTRSIENNNTDPILPASSKFISRNLKLDNRQPVLPSRSTENNNIDPSLPTSSKTISTSCLPSYIPIVTNPAQTKAYNQPAVLPQPSEFPHSDRRGDNCPVFKFIVEKIIEFSENRPEIVGHLSEIKNWSPRLRLNYYGYKQGIETEKRLFGVIRSDINQRFLALKKARKMERRMQALEQNRTLKQVLRVKARPVVNQQIVFLSSDSEEDSRGQKKTLDTRMPKKIPDNLDADEEDDEIIYIAPPPIPVVVLESDCSDNEEMVSQNDIDAIENINSIKEDKDTEEKCLLDVSAKEKTPKSARKKMQNKSKDVDDLKQQNELNSSRKVDPNGTTEQRTPRRKKKNSNRSTNSEVSENEQQTDLNSSLEVEPECTKEEEAFRKKKSGSDVANTSGISSIIMEEEASNASNDFLVNELSESQGDKFDFALHGSDFTNTDFVRPANPTECYETESSTSTSDFNKDSSRNYSNSVKTIVFNEVEFPKEDIFTNNLEGFEELITSKEIPASKKRKTTKDKNDKDKQKRSKKDAVSQNKILESDSSSESDYEQNFDNLPSLSPMVRTSSPKKSKNSPKLPKKKNKRLSEEPIESLEESTGKKKKKRRSSVPENIDNELEIEVEDTSLGTSVLEESLISRKKKSKDAKVHDDSLQGLTVVDEALESPRKKCKKKKKKASNKETEESRDESILDQIEMDAQNFFKETDKQIEETRIFLEETLQIKKKKKANKKKKKQNNTTENEDDNVAIEEKEISRKKKKQSVEIEESVAIQEVEQISKRKKKHSNNTSTTENEESSTVIEEAEKPSVQKIDEGSSNNPREDEDVGNNKEDDDVILIDNTPAPIEILESDNDSDLVDDGPIMESPNLVLANITSIINEPDKPVSEKDYSEFDVANLQAKMSDDPSLWQISIHDRVVDSGKKRGPRCLRCKQFGHIMVRCKNKPSQPSCQLCGEVGHLEPRCHNKICFSCGNKGNFSTVYCYRCVQNRNVECTICKCLGHSSQNCPDLWRRYHLTTIPGPLVKPKSGPQLKPKKERCCCGCALRGHLDYECTSYKYIREYPAVVPFIKNYSCLFGEDKVVENRSDSAVTARENSETDKDSSSHGNVSDLNAKTIVGNKNLTETPHKDLVPSVNSKDTATAPIDNVVESTSLNLQPENSTKTKTSDTKSSVKDRLGPPVNETQTNNERGSGSTSNETRFSNETNFPSNPQFFQSNQSIFDINTNFLRQLTGLNNNSNQPAIFNLIAPLASNIVANQINNVLNNCGNNGTGNGVPQSLLPNLMGSGTCHLNPVAFNDIPNSNEQFNPQQNTASHFGNRSNSPWNFLPNTQGFNPIFQLPNNYNPNFESRNDLTQNSVPIYDVPHYANLMQADVETPSPKIRDRRGRIINFHYTPPHRLQEFLRGELSTLKKLCGTPDHYRTIFYKTNDPQNKTRNRQKRLYKTLNMYLFGVKHLKEGKRHFECLQKFACQTLTDANASRRQNLEEGYHYIFGANSSAKPYIEDEQSAVEIVRAFLEKIQLNSMQKEEQKPVESASVVLDSAKLSTVPNKSAFQQFLEKSSKSLLKTKIISVEDKPMNTLKPPCARLDSFKLSTVPNVSVESTAQNNTQKFLENSSKSLLKTPNQTKNLGIKQTNQTKNINIKGIALNLLKIQSSSSKPNNKDNPNPLQSKVQNQPGCHPISSNKNLINSKPNIKGSSNPLLKSKVQNNPGCNPINSNQDLIKPYIVTPLANINVLKPQSLNSKPNIKHTTNLLAEKDKLTNQTKNISVENKPLNVLKPQSSNSKPNIKNSPNPLLKSKVQNNPGCNTINSNQDLIKPYIVPPLANINVLKPQSLNSKPNIKHSTNLLAEKDKLTNQIKNIRVEDKPWNVLKPESLNSKLNIKDSLNILPEKDKLANQTKDIRVEDKPLNMLKTQCSNNGPNTKISLNLSSEKVRRSNESKSLFNQQKSNTRKFSLSGQKNPWQLKYKSKVPNKRGCYPFHSNKNLVKPYIVPPLATMNPWQSNDTSKVDVDRFDDFGMPPPPGRFYYNNIPYTGHYGSNQNRYWRGSGRYYIPDYNNPEYWNFQ